MSGKGTVLVTGGSGFIGSWCVIELLRQDYAVLGNRLAISKARKLALVARAAVDTLI